MRLWYEDPSPDAGNSTLALNKLREMIRTPFLISAMKLSWTERMNLVLAKATDFVRGYTVADGITGTLKLAHAAESWNSTSELHGACPAHRHVMAAVRNSSYYEFGLDSSQCLGLEAASLPAWAFRMLPRGHRR